jgi:hypothetical protein
VDAKKNLRRGIVVSAIMASATKKPVVPVNVKIVKIVFVRTAANCAISMMDVENLCAEIAILRLSVNGKWEGAKSASMTINALIVTSAQGTGNRIQGFYIHIYHSLIA